VLGGKPHPVARKREDIRFRGLERWAFHSNRSNDVYPDSLYCKLE
jgi:hypothetical protein